MSRNEFGLDWDSHVSESDNNRTREQTIVWWDDFENIEFRSSTADDERIVSEEVIICTHHGSKSVGLFCKRKDVLYFEANSGMRLTLDRIKEWAFLE